MYWIKKNCDNEYRTLKITNILSKLESYALQNLIHKWRNKNQTHFKLAALDQHKILFWNLFFVWHYAIERSWNTSNGFRGLFKSPNRFLSKYFLFMGNKNVLINLQGWYLNFYNNSKFVTNAYYKARLDYFYEFYLFEN